MSVEQTQATMEAYIASLLNSDDYQSFFADDIVVTFAGIGRVVKGRTAGKQAIDGLLNGDFEAELEIKHVMVGLGRASHEATLIGAQLWEVAGAPPNGRRVDILHSVFYELKDDKITALRIYGLVDGLVRQLSTVE